MVACPVHDGAERHGAPMNYGFLIDNSACIGCHACSTACKSENSVPVGVSRTWVKYTEHGTYPDVRRNFQVTRCNHCTNPPCMRICPVGAMYQRDDGIVEFDSDACIGCKGCIQACPYDAIHLDPETHTAAKCHFCSHRIDVGLEPACAVVCPEEAIIAGDLDDPESFISKRLANAKVTVRKPEQGTGPKVFYIDGEDVAQHPTAASPIDDVQRAMSFDARVPALVVHDVDDDVIAPAVGQQLAEGMQRGMYLQTEGLGHYRVLRDREVVRQVVAFMADVDVDEVSWLTPLEAELELMGVI
jgi:Fe-S-cluster-containing dehydrogenase component